MDSVQAQGEIQAEAFKPAVGAMGRLQDAGGRAMDEFGSEAIARAMREWMAGAPERAAEAIACAVGEGLGSI